MSETLSSPAARARGSRRAGFALVAGMATFMWFSEIFDAVSGLQLDQYGIEPRDPEGSSGWSPPPSFTPGSGTWPPTRCRS